MSIMVGVADDKGDLGKLKLAFRQMDKDGDGNLTIEELKKTAVVYALG